jgi:acetyl-CoA acetyltransferase
MRNVYVAGVGMTAFGKFPDRRFEDLGAEAVRAAIDDAGLQPRQIEAGYAGHARTGQVLGWESGVGQAVLWEAGITGIPVVGIANFCSSGGSAFREAWVAVGSGLVDCAIAIGIEKLSVRGDKGQPFRSDGVELEGHLGFTPPAYFAMVAQRHQMLYGTTAEQMAAVSVKNRRHAAANPRAQYRNAVTQDQVLASPVIADPLTMLQCAPTGDGAAAAILVSEALAKQLSRDTCVRVADVQLVSGNYDPTREITSFQATMRAARQAYERAGIGPEDVDVAEVHDCFSIAEIIHYEDLGFCERGAGGRFVERASLGGSVAVSTSGGLLSKGHPLGATGVAQVAELTWQLRGQATGRQAENARVGLAHVVGGFQAADAASVSLVLLQR